MTANTKNGKLLACSLIVAGFVLEIGASLLMLLVDGRNSVQPGGLMLICGAGLLLNGIWLLQKQQQG